MSVPLAGYSTRRVLRVSPRRRVYEAERERDHRRVVAKVFEIADEASEARVEHEFRLLHGLAIEGVVRALGLERAGRQLVLLLEYVPGHNLAQEAGGEPLPLPRFMARALSMVEILARIHARRVIHRDIKPSNILVDETRDAIVFADFGISVLLEDERRNLYDPDMLEGTLPYVSPEQTGRTQREVDYRSDLYSLGVTFYELLTGARPFEASEPFELVHAHLALVPASPRERNPSVPALLSSLVMKLLEKAPERRYQSALGLHADLQRLASELAAGRCEPSFTLGESDHPLALALPRRLYGRAHELALLEAELALVRKTRGRRLVVVRGAKGVGKTAMLHGLDVPLVACAGLLGLGRSEADAREPHRALVQALRALLEQLLAASDERLASVRACLREALGPIAGVLVGPLPELVPILGPTALPPELELEHAQNRATLAFSRLLAGLAQLGPIVLALDDMHLADAASLELLAALLGEVGGPVLVLAAFDDEAARDDADAPLARLLAALEPDSTRTLALAELAPPELEALLAATLGRTREDVVELAAYVARKTAGRPLFVAPLLEHLVELGHVRPAAHGWTWDLEALVAARVPGDLLGILATRIARLAAPERRVLERAACVGERFNPSSLLLDEHESIDAELLALELAGLIDRVGPERRFAHARVRTSVLELIDPATRADLHRRLGWRRLARLGGAAALLARPDELSFEIVDQLDAGHARGEPEVEPERARELALLLVRAGERALARAAWPAAVHYFERALELPLDDPRERFTARFGLAQALGFAGRMAESDACFEALLAEPLAPADLALVVARRARTLVASGETRRALEFARVHIEAQGFDVPAEPSTLRLLLALARAWGPVTRLDRARLLALPEVEDPRVRAAMHMLAAATSSAFSTDQQLFVHLVAIHARLVARHGYHDTAIDVLAAFAFTQVAMGKVAAANRLIDDVIELARARGHPTALPGAIGIRSMFVGPSLRPFRECAQPMETSHRQALELGDRLDAGLVGSIALVLHLEAGTHLAELRGLFERLHVQHEGWISPEYAAIAGIAMRVVDRVATPREGEPPEPLRVQPPPPPEFDAPDISALTRHAAIVSAAWAALLLGELDEAWAQAQRIADTYERAMFGSWVIPRFALIDAVLVAERASKASGGARRRLARRLQRRLATLRRWAALGPENFAALAELAAGEHARLAARSSAATQHYERARNLAAAQGRAWVEVLACQRLAALADACGWSLVAEGALAAAHRSAERWGAWAIVERLEQRSGALARPSKLEETIGSASASRSQPRASSSERTKQRSTSLTLKADLASLDLAAVLGTVQMIGEDLRLEEVITRVLGSAITNAGADRGLLLLEREGEPWLVAEGHDARPRAFLDQPVSLAAASERVPRAVIHFVSRTNAGLVSDELGLDARFAADPYVATAGVRSLLCMPILKQGTRIGMLVLENRLQAGAFTYERLETSRILLAQAASAIDNARLYAELARSETQWRSLVDGAPDMITLLDEQGRIEFVNHLASLGRSPASLIGQPGDVLLEPDARERWQAAFAEVLASAGLCELELTLRGAGEQRRVAMVRLACLAVAGQRRRVLSIATDITERRQLEAQLREQQRIESIGTLAAGVAHEINNPVQGILNYAELLHDRPGDPALVREFSLEITQESQRVAEIVRNLLAFARQEREQGFEEVDVRELIEATLSLIRAVMRRDQIRLELELPDVLPRLHCRPQPIRQIIMNLVTNARDALNERYPSFDERKRIVIAVETFAADTWLRVSVRDQAGGIPESLRTRIFDPFFTTKGRDKGTGLGLSVSHGIAREHGGDLRVESEVGLGSRFLLELPLSGR